MPSIHISSNTLTRIFTALDHQHTSYDAISAKVIEDSINYYSFYRFLEKLFFCIPSVSTYYSIKSADLDAKKKVLVGPILRNLSAINNRNSMHFRIPEALITIYNYNGDIHATINGLQTGKIISGTLQDLKNKVYGEFSKPSMYDNTWVY